MIKRENLYIEGVELITCTRHHDFRGYFTETWRNEWIPEITFVQDMWSFNEKANTLRGLHSLKGEYSQYKLVMILSGNIFDVIVDARKESKTYGNYISLMLSSKEPTAVLIPPGCYHGFLTLTNNTLVGYKVDKYHSPELDSGIVWNDKDLNISWPLTDIIPIISEKDKNLPAFKEI